MIFPSQNGIWRSAPGLNYFADLVRTRGIDVSTPGLLKVANKPIQLYSDADDTNFSRVVALVPDDNAGNYYLVTTDHVFSISAATAAVSEITATNMPNVTGGSDAVFFAGKLHVSGDTTVKDYDGAWNNHLSGLSASYPILLEVFENRVNLAVANGNTVKLYDTSYSLIVTLTIPTQFVVSTMRYHQGTLFVGTRHIYGGEAKMFVWDGGTTSAQQGYGVGSSWVYSMEPFDGSVAIVTSAGLLRRFNGGGFENMAELPVYRSQFSWMSSASIATSSFGNIPHRGMTAHGDTLYLNLSGSLNQNIYDFPGQYLPEQPSGIWVYKRTNGLTHYAGYGNVKYRTLTVSSLASSVLDLGGVGHYLETGDPVFANSVSNITGITASHLYFCIKQSETSLKLALTRADALNGDAITLSGTPSGDTLVVDASYSLGATFDANPGAICAISTPFSNTFFGTEILFAGEPIDATGTTIHALYSMGRQAGSGTLVLSSIPASGVTDTFKKLYIGTEQIRYERDIIRLKYRVSPRAGLPTPGRTSASGFATWTSASSFTIDTTTKDFKSVEVGDEIEIISGAGAGQTAHIESIDTTTSNYAITLESNLAGIVPGDYSEVIAEDWKKIPVSVTSDTQGLIQGYAEVPLGVTSGLLDLKVELSGYDVAIRYLDIIQSPSKPRS